MLQSNKLSCQSLTHLVSAVISTHQRVLLCIPPPKKHALATSRCSVTSACCFLLPADHFFNIRCKWPEVEEMDFTWWAWEATVNRPIVTPWSYLDFLGEAISICCFDNTAVLFHTFTPSLCFLMLSLAARGAYINPNRFHMSSKQSLHCIGTALGMKDLERV